MRLAVLGATGTIGRRVCERASAHGHEVLAMSRAGGVDASTGDGLVEALSGADAMVDCLDIKTISARAAERFFTTTAANVLAAARGTEVSRLVVVSIAGVQDPAVTKGFGYYRAKSLQEDVYRAGSLPTTIVRSTQWYELLSDLVRRSRLGPVAILPTMRIAPLAAEAAAELVVLQAQDTGGSAHRVVTIRGPQETTAAQAARELLTAGHLDGPGPRLIGELPYLGRAIATGGLIPSEAVVDSTTLRTWSERRQHHP